VGSQAEGAQKKLGVAQEFGAGHFPKGKYLARLNTFL
jgi:hypothetical protein